MGNYEREEEASWCTTVCLAASFLIPSNAASLSFLHPCTFFLGIDDTRRGNFLFFRRRRKGDSKSCLVQSSPIIPSVKVASRTFLLSFFVFGYGYDNNLFDVQVNCFHFGRQNSDVKAYVTTTVWYLFADSNRNTNISVSLFPEDFTRKARKPYHILESHLESLLWSEFCWVFISSKR